MAVALNRQDLERWIGSAIDHFRQNDLIGVPQAWLDIYESLADYILEGRSLDQQMFWRFEGTDDDLPDIIFQLQRLKNTLVETLLRQDEADEVVFILNWFDRAIVNLTEKWTGKVSTERALLEPYEAIFWKARDGMYISTIEGKFVHGNQALIDMLGYNSIDDLREVEISTQLYAESDVRTIMLDHLLTDGYFDRHELQYRNAHGELCTALESCYLVDAPGKRQFIVGILVDISEYKNMEAQSAAFRSDLERETMDARLGARRQHRRYHTLMELNDHPVVLLNPQGLKVVEANNAFYRAFNLNKKQMTENSFESLFETHAWMTVFSQLSGNLDRHHYHIRDIACYTSDDVARHFDLSVMVHDDDEGSRLYVQFEDRTDLQRLKTRLEDARNNVREVMDAAAHGMIVFRNDGSVAFVNRHMRELTGFANRKLMNISFMNQLFIRDRQRLKFHKYVNNFLRGRHVRNEEIELKTRAGAPLRLWLSTVPFQLDNEQTCGFLALVTHLPLGSTLEKDAILRPTEKLPLLLEMEKRDLQDRLEELESKLAMLERKGNFKREFVQRFVKKFKVPIHVVLGYLSLLRKDIGVDMPSDIHEDLSIIEEHVDIALSMLEDVVLFVQLEDNAISPFIEPAPVRAFLDSLLAQVEPKSLPQGVAFKSDHQMLRMDLTVATDPHLVGILLRHLIDNALDYTPQGTITLTAFQQDGSLWLELKDTGKGISSCDLSHLFEPFFQAGADNPHKEHLGLGLAISKHIADLLHAEIHVESKPNEGTCIQIRLGMLTKLPD